MREIRLKARAKINLTLDVTGKREDGNHLLETIMQTEELYDGINMKKLEKPVIKLKTNLPWLPTDARNLAWKAANLMRETFGIKEGVFIEIDKRIPVAAGLAGGSTDCAAVLVGMNRLFGLGLSEAQLEEVAGRLGSDIPYCIRRGTVLCEGVGEVMTNVAHPCPDCYVVLAKLPVSVSTASVYKQLRWQEIEQHPDAKAMLKAMEEKDVAKMGKLLSNVLETVTIELHPRNRKNKSTFDGIRGGGCPHERQRSNGVCPVYGQSKGKKGGGSGETGVCPEGLLGNKNLSGTKRAERRT